MSNRSVELTAIDLSKESAWLNALRRNAQPAAFREVEFSEDDLERPVTTGTEEEETVAAPAAPLDTSNPPEGVYSPIMVFENDLREYYPRRGERSGTRLVYRSGAARPVKESYDEVKAKFAALYPVSVPQVAAPAPRSRPSRAAMTEAQAAVSA